MKQTLIHKLFLFWTFLVLMVAGHLISPAPALPDHPLLKEIIIAYNLEALKESLIDSSNRGEEGILRIRPEIAKSLGMEVFIDQDYMDAKELFEKGDISLEEAQTAMSSEEKEKFHGELVEKIADLFLSHKRSEELAKEKLMTYRSRLNSWGDARLNESVSAEVIDRVLEESLKKTDYRLRDALGRFFNVCQGQDGDNPSLTPENVIFVNHVFYRFISEASERELKMFDLDRDAGQKRKPSYDWKSAVGKKASQYIPLLESTFKKFENKIYSVDPLLFFALMKRESRFDPLAVSPVGAVGLTQIMPKTGKDLGMKNIYVPTYFGKAVSVMKQERRTKEEAEAALFEITEANKLYQARRARELMQKSLRLGKQRENLFSKYKRELIKKRTDDRLKPSLAIEYGLIYFARMMRAQGGDMSLALASYNAGPYRVRKFKGIPPYEETVFFRNRVLEYYRDYLRKAKGSP